MARRHEGPSTVPLPVQAWAGWDWPGECAVVPLATAAMQFAANV